VSAEPTWSQVGTDLGMKAVAGLNFEVAQTSWSGGDRRLGLQMEEMGGSEASRYRPPRLVV